MVDLKILPYFFQLEFEFHTTAIILDELFDEQREALFPYIETGSLIVDDISDEDLGVNKNKAYFRTKSILQYTHVQFSHRSTTNLPFFHHLVLPNHSFQSSSGYKSHLQRKGLW